MTKKVIMHQILPASISNFLLLENRDKDPMGMDFEQIKNGIVSYLKVARGERALMAGSAELDPGAEVNEGAWDQYREAEWWPEQPDQGQYGQYAGEAEALNKGKGKGKGQFQGNCNRCGKWGHRAADCWKGKGKGKGPNGNSKGYENKGNKGKGKGKDVCNNCGKSGHWARECPERRPANAAWHGMGQYDNHSYRGIPILGSMGRGQPWEGQGAQQPAWNGPQQTGMPAFSMEIGGFEMAKKTMKPMRLMQTEADNEGKGKFDAIAPDEPDVDSEDESEDEDGDHNR